MEGGGRGLICFEKRRKTTKPLSQASRYSGRDLNRILPNTKQEWTTCTETNQIRFWKYVNENHEKPINRLCGQNAELSIVKADGTCSYHWGLKNNKRELKINNFKL
jgi:hypothetical protein